MKWIKKLCIGCGYSAWNEGQPKFCWASKKWWPKHFVTFFLWKNDIRYQYINNFQINCFLSITLKFILSLVSRGLGALQGNFGTGVQLKLRKHPNAYIAIKWNLNLFVITFLTTLTPMAMVVWRNDASPSDGVNKRLVCVRGDQCHDHIKDIRKRVD